MSERTRINIPEILIDIMCKNIKNEKIMCSIQRMLAEHKHLKRVYGKILANALDSNTYSKRVLYS